MNQLPFPLVISQRGYAPLRIGTTFTYRGPFPWRCLLCSFPVLPGESAFHLWAGISLLLAHEPGTCPQLPVAVDGTDPPTSRS